MRSLLLLLFSVLTFTVTSQPVKVVRYQSPKPQELWELSAKTHFFASPVVLDSVVYLGGTDGIFLAIGIHSGRVNWRFRTGGEIRSTPCTANERIYLNGGDANIYALDLSGKVIWQFATGGEKKYDFADYFQSSPVVNHGRVYVGSGDGCLYCLDASAGKLIWKYQSGGIVHTTPAISGGKVFFGSFDGYVYALNLADGSLAWKFKTVGHRFFPVGEVQGSPAVFRDVVVIGARDYNVYAIDQQKGFCRWNKAFPNGWGLSNTVHDSVLYIGCSDEKKLIAADPATGSEYWNKPMELLIFGSPVFTDTLLVIGTTIGKLHGISKKTGAKTWTFETHGYRVNHLKYFKPDDSYRDDIYSIITSNEQFLDVQCELGGIFSTPCIYGKLIVVACTNGTIYCLEM